ncbi:MAG: retron Ec67 family RNA-directed DNA polymerase/endonuclease [Anaerovoracaceae bacterium]
MEKFSDIKTRNDLADYLRISRKKLTYILYVEKPDSYYKTFEIPKKNGETRTICAPYGDLKSLQTKLANALWEHQQNLRNSTETKPNISHAFEKGKSIITNAKIHRNKRFVLNMDLENFFDSFHFGRVQGYFEKSKVFLLPREVSIIIAQIACYNGRLPQGAPSSPIITNLICQILDMRILKIAKKYKLDYTRYADDLTFSTNSGSFFDNQESFIREVSSVISNAGFIVNSKKTRLLYKDSRQEVTGLVVNKKINVNRTYARKTKAMAHQLYTTGEFTINGIPADIKQLEGRFAFINQLDLYNNKLDDAKHDAYHLNGRELQYRAFMFYKYFYTNDLPLIVTEGKTDVRYLKAALMKFYTKYPDLIEKDDKGKFIFKIRFFRRSKRWRYFFGISLDGGDAMKVLYRYFTGKKGATNYFSYFQKISGREQNSPVILLYDNETESKRPLKTFLCEDTDITDAQREELKNTLQLKLLPNSKLFLLTNPLVDEKTECEIEDLFSTDLLGLVLGGKTFSRKDKPDKNKHYGKDIFSEYVLANYQFIDFQRFVPLLDTLNSIVKNTKK